jgi:uncharacterized protein YuzE
MKVKYDSSVDAAYISLLDEDERMHPFGFTYACDPADVNGQIHLDFDTAGRLIGIELLNASKLLSPRLLKPEE